MQDLKSAGCKIALATSAPTENVDLVLGKLGIFDMFDVLVDATLVNKGKPDPEIYLTTVTKLNCRTENCVVFEDSISGISSASGAGLTVIGLTTSHSKTELLDAGASLTIHDFSEISLTQLNHQMSW